MTIATVAGGSLTAGSIYLWVQARNRTGYNLLSDGATTPSSAGFLVNFASGEKIAITFNTGSRLAGEDVWEFCVSGSLTDDPSSAKALASIRTKDTATVGTVSYPGKGASLSLPLTIELTQDEHIQPGVFVVDSSSLPTSPLHGMVRYVQEVGEHWVFDDQAATGEFASSGGYWVVHLTGFSQYVFDITQPAISDIQPQGYARQINQLATGVQSDTVIETAPYLFDNVLQDSTHAPLFAISNSLGNATLPIDTQVVMRWYANGQNISSAMIGKAIVTLQGKVDLATGTLDVTPDGVGSPLSLGPILDGVGGIQTPEALDDGFAFVYRVQLQADQTAVNTPDSPIQNGDTLTYYPLAQSPLGERAAFASFLGAGVAQVSDSMVVLPSTGTALATVAPGVLSSLNNSTFQGTIVSSSMPKDVLGLSSSVDGQVVAINPAYNSVIVHSSAADVKSYEEQRAIVGTGLGPAGGNFSPSDWSPSVAVAGNTETLSISVTYPSAIRATYPDPQIAGLPAPFNAPQIVPYVRLSGTIYQLPALVVSGSSQTFTIADIGSTSVTAIPNSDSVPNFGLFGYDTIAVTSVAGASTLVAGNYEIALQYLYTGGQVTSVNHNVADGNIRIIPQLSGLALLNQTQTFVGGQYYQPVPLSSNNGIVTINFILGNYFSLTLTENVTTIAIANLAAGTNVTLEIINPGDYTVAGWDNGFVWIGGAEPESPVGWSAYNLTSFDGLILRAAEWGVGSEPEGDGSGSGQFNADKILIDANGSILIDANGNVLVEA